MKITLSHADIAGLTGDLAKAVNTYAATASLAKPRTNPMAVYPIPRGGIPVAYALLSQCPIRIVDHPSAAELFIDDLIDSGSTCERYCDQFPGVPFFALIDKRIEGRFHGKWITFPWEVTDSGNDDSATDIIVRLMQFIGENPHREGLQETPARVIKAWRHWTSGYGKDAGSILKVFEDGAERYDQMVIVKDIPIYSHCEHHLAAIIGTATIAYIPNGKIVGLSKLSRLTDMFARRLQVQERLTDQIADALVEHLQPLGVGVLIKARHLCMESRGVCQQGHHTITTALRGAIRDDAQARSEFLGLAN